MFVWHAIPIIDGTNGRGDDMNLKRAIGVLIVAGMAFPGIAVPQDNNTDLSTHMATGCLRKGAIARNYALTDEDGKTWNLRSKTVPLGRHAGHTVTVTGTIPADSKGSGETAPQNDLLVTKVDEVRDNCKQP
jgi:hypothetical protein